MSTRFTPTLKAWAIPVKEWVHWFGLSSVWMMWIMSLLWRSVVTILNFMETSLVSTIRAVVRSMRSTSLSLRRQLMARRLSLSRTFHLILLCSIVKVGSRCLVSLLRCVSKTHLTKKIIAVHIWPLFFYELIFFVLFINCYHSHSF